ncbi:polysaccharide deacetylase family protein [Desulfovibrio sp. OttesenSCG-928-A18]|nr:polysaccharide deacetylase family protein [Desulfovibrio sp. OttesenSCG-928-A18]
MFSRKAKSLPVLIYHSINGSGLGLSVSPALFERHCRLLAEKGWKGVGLAEAEAFLLHGETLPPRSFLLSMDDGYLDNYVYAWPILRKYGHKAVIFPVADSISESTSLLPEGAALRPTLDDVWNGALPYSALTFVDSPLQDGGLGFKVRRDSFFSWPEARAMEAEGSIGIGGHSLRHEAVFISPEFNGFHQPGPEKNAFSHTVRANCWGMPRFRRGEELLHRAFIPSAELVERIRDLVPQDDAGAVDFFADAEKVRRLSDLVEKFRDNLGSLESEKEQHERIYRIMHENQLVLQKELGRLVRSFCWPWGKRNALSLAAGRAAGFELFFNVGPGPNPPGRPLSINRFNAKDDPVKNLNRVRIYSRPLLGELYRRCRL